MSLLCGAPHGLRGQKDETIALRGTVTADEVINHHRSKKRRPFPRNVNRAASPRKTHTEQDPFNDGENARVTGSGDSARQLAAGDVPD